MSVFFCAHNQNKHGLQENVDCKCHTCVLSTLVVKPQTPAATSLQCSTDQKITLAQCRIVRLQIFQQHQLQKLYNHHVEEPRDSALCVKARPDCMQLKPKHTDCRRKWRKTLCKSMQGIDESRASHSNKKLLQQHIYIFKPLDARQAQWA